MNGNYLFLAIGMLACLKTNAQMLEANLQLRPRYEYRDGYKSPLQETESPASFISQRSRLNLTFKNENLLTKISAQNVRVWGDVPSTTTADKNGVMLFEAWAQYFFNTAWSLKTGRQVISFDNQRIMGEIDWAQQGQSHDAAVLKYSIEKHSLDAGASLSSNTENITEVPYNIPNYKALQFVHYKTKYRNFDFSFLLLNTGYEFIRAEKPQTKYSQTFGSYITYKKDKFSANMGIYGQTGKRANSDVKAWYTGINANYKFNSCWKIRTGFELLSGKGQNDGDNEIKSFTPLFGTNHAFNGFMDYFYVGNHQNSVGLQDVFLSLVYTKQKLTIEAIPHFFWSHASIYKDTEKLQNFLGAELDLSAKYLLNKRISIHSGYSLFIDAEGLRVLKGVTGKNQNNWIWLMIIINMDLYKSL